MTLAEARKICKSPKFGDPLSIQAANMLRNEAKASLLRSRLLGKKISCGPCGGTGDRCKICDPDGMVTLTKEWLANLPLDILEDIDEELRGIAWS